MSDGRCTEHEDREARHRCSECASDLCTECVAQEEPRLLCASCAIAHAGAAIEESSKASKERAREERERTPKRKSSVPFRVALALGSVLIAVEVALLLLTAPTTAVERPIVQPTKESAAAGGAADMALLQAGLEQHRYETGSYPNDLRVLADRLPRPLADAVRKGEINYERLPNGGFRIGQRAQEAVVPLVVDGPDAAPVPLEVAQ